MFHLRKAVATLLSYSFLTRADGDTLSIHPLVHRWARRRLSAEDRDAVSHDAALLVFQAYTFHGTLEVKSNHRLEPHLIALTKHFKSLWDCGEKLGLPSEIQDHSGLLSWAASLLETTNG